MKIRHISIRNYRGIKELDWFPGGNYLCLIGPGNSTKSTILNAMELVLSPRWNINFEDTDFYNADTSHPIEIIVSIGELTENLECESKFGLMLKGWSEQNGLRDEPIQEEGDEHVLSIQLTVDSSLEPSWQVINERNQEGKAISSKDREKIGLVRVGSYIDRHLTWSKGTALAKLTESSEQTTNVLTKITRTAKSAFPSNNVPELVNTAEIAQNAGKEMGVTIENNYSADLDLQSVHIGLGGISLHDGVVPLKNSGLGTRRLLTIGLQKQLTGSNPIILIDEIEHGLEPYRIRHLVSSLKKESLDSSDTATSTQLFITTHSPTAVVELGTEQLRIVRSQNGVTKILPIPVDLQGIVRILPEALFAKKLIVCEGKTEVGFCRALGEVWSQSENCPPLSCVGVVPISPSKGGGSNTPKIAKHFLSLGFSVAILADSDRADTNKQIAQISSSRLDLFQWDGNTSIEKRLLKDLPWEGVLELIEFAIEEIGESVIQELSEQLGVELTREFSNWLNIKSEEELRETITFLAEKGKESGENKGWFKRIDHGEKLGFIVAKYLTSMSATPCFKTIEELKSWVYKNDNTSTAG